MKHIVSLTHASSRHNFETTVQFRGEQVLISHFGTDFDAKVMEELIKRFDGQCDVIALSGIHPPVTLGKKTYTHPDTNRFTAMVQNTPVTNGFGFRNTYLTWAIRNHAKKCPTYFAHKRIAFVSGLVMQPVAKALNEYSDRLYFADPLVHLSMPWAIEGLEGLHRYASVMKHVLLRVSLKNTSGKLKVNSKASISMRRFNECDLIVTTSTLLERIDISVVKGKTVLLDTLSPEQEVLLKEAGARDVLHFMPQVSGLGTKHRLNYPIFEALLMVTAENRDMVTTDDVLEFIDEQKLRPQIHSLSTSPVASHRKFAFIVHPLTGRDLFRHPALRPFSKPMSNRNVEKGFEKMLTVLPGIAYGRITGIRSESTGATAEGLIYTLFDTPREMLAQSPERIYSKILKICDHAAAQGADLIGLGAFTKIVGDAGITIAQRSPIPVTTGNSLSASATLWAARVASAKMGFLPAYKYGEKITGTAMVIGAAGSIGAVSARLLARVVTRLVLVGPKPDRLMELKESILKESDIEIIIATSPNKLAAQCDLIVISTSATEGEVLDISSVASGAVICDVSRPLAYKAEQVITRPDVLVIESGEVELPGKVELSCDIGLEDNIVYACLAETALLALEGRLENFTLSRNIQYQKVREIYDMARKHGARLAEIRGPLGLITDQEIDLCREHAHRRRSTTTSKPARARAPQVSNLGETHV